MQQSNGGLFTHAGYAGYIIDLVARQGEKIDYQRRRQAEFFLHTRFVKRFILHGVDQRDVGIDQLRHVLIASRDHRIAPCLGRVMRQGANHIVCLDAFNA